MRKLKDKLLELSHNKGLIKVRNYKKGYVRKGITALFLALTLTVSSLGGGDLYAVKAGSSWLDSNIYDDEDENQEITIVNKGELKEDMEVKLIGPENCMYRYSFVPKETAIYTFYTVGSSATYVRLYDSNGTQIQSGGNSSKVFRLNCCISKKLIGGEMYYFDLQESNFHSIACNVIVKQMDMDETYGCTKDIDNYGLHDQEIQFEPVLYNIIGEEIKNPKNMTYLWYKGDVDEDEKDDNICLGTDKKFKTKCDGYADCREYSALVYKNEKFFEKVYCQTKVIEYKYTMNQGEKLEDLDEYTTLLEFTPEKSGYYKLYTTGLNTGTLRLYKDKDYTKNCKNYVAMAEENAEDCKNVTIEYYLKAGETYSFIMEYFYYNVRMSVAINFVGDETSTTEKNSEEDVITSNEITTNATQTTDNGVLDNSQTSKNETGISERTDSQACPTTGNVTVKAPVKVKIKKAYKKKNKNKNKTKICLLFNKVGNANKYEIKISDNKKFKKKKTKTKLSRKTSYTFSGLAKSKKYYIKVRAVKVVGKNKKYGKWSKVYIVK
ncbi:fibronectin type III domain-containing protein [Eubacterium sp. Marseille-QA0814]|uniref:fibronectin type III domain-containing protein n=1 Tax=Eubacterium sp. Marseille-QA0814 TaxID=3378778 RepID=UPI003D0C59BB